jgi:hypothetical protein
VGILFLRRKELLVAQLHGTFSSIVGGLVSLLATPKEKASNESRK